MIADDTAMRIAAAFVCATLPLAVLSALSVVFRLQVRNVVVTAIEVGNGILWGRTVARSRYSTADLVAMAAAFLVVADPRHRLRGPRPAQLAGALAARPLWPDLLLPSCPSASADSSRSATDTSTGSSSSSSPGRGTPGLYGMIYRIYERIQFLPAAS